MESEPISRREFLGFLGLVGGALLLSGCEKYFDLPAPTLTMTPKGTSAEVPTATPIKTSTSTSTSTETEHFTVPKIMLLGDSLITLGKIPTYLNQELATANLSVEFVGDNQTTGNTVPAEGHGGFDTSLMARELIRETYWQELNGIQIPNNFSEHIPDIVIIQLGTNDAINASENGFDPVLSYKSNMQRMIGYLRSKNPSVNIIIPLLIPSLDKNYDVNVIKLNSTIPDLVIQLNTKVSRVVTTRDLRDSWTLNDFADNVHPNTSGQQKIAKAYYNALVENKYLTKMPTFSQQSSPK